MWLWWIVSVIVLVFCIIFAISVFTTSRKLRSLVSFDNNRSPAISDPYARLSTGMNINRTDQQIAELNMKLRLLEENSHNSNLEIGRINNRLAFLERSKIATVQPQTTRQSNDENWEELYFEAQEKNEKLENQLDHASGKIEDLETKMAEMINNRKAVSEELSKVEQQLINSLSLQQTITQLQQKLDGAAEREAELRKQLAREENLRGELQKMKNQYAKAQSEAADLRDRMTELSNREIVMQKKLSRLSELESSVNNAEYDRDELQRTVDEIILENGLLISKLTELQDKLRHEKYV